MAAEAPALNHRWLLPEMDPVDEQFRSLYYIIIGLAAGSAGMAQTPDISSSQNALLLNLNGTLQAGTLIHIEDSGGNTVLTMAPSKAYQSIALSSPNLVSGETYTVYYGGSDSGTLTDSLYSSGTYSGGTEYTSFTISSTVTMIGNAGRP